MSTTKIEKGGHTVTIFTPNTGRRYHQVTWRCGGRLYKKNFGATCRDKAEEKANSVLDMLNQGHASLAHLDHRVVGLINIYAQQLGIDRMQRYIEDGIKRYTSADIQTGDAVEHYIASQKNNRRSNRHLQTIRQNLRRFAATFKKALNRIEAHEIDDYLSRISSNTKTRLNHRSSIIAFYGYAQRKGWLPIDRKTAAHLSERPSTIPADPQIFTPDEMRILLQSSPEDLLPYLVIAGFAGARAAEIQRLTWSAWNSADSTLTFDRNITKTARRRIIAVEPNLAAWLSVLSKGRTPSDPIIVAQNLSRARSPFVEKSKVVWKNNGLRHSYASYHLELHGNAHLTSKHCGHSVRELETVYMKLTTKAQAQDWFAIFPPQSEQNAEECSHPPSP